MQRGNVGDRNATKRVVVVDRAPTPVRSRDSGGHGGGASRDGGGRFDRGGGERQQGGEPDFGERRQPRGEAPYRPAHHDYDRPDSDFRPNYRALESRPQDNRDSRPYGGDRGRPARPPHGGGRGREDDASDRPHVLWPPRVVVNDFDGAAITLPRIAGTPLTLPEDMTLVHQQLSRRFPEAFPADPVPLSLTVEKEVARALGDAELVATVEAFLFVYRAHPAYLASVVRNTRRVTLDGARAERIEPEEREQALWTLRALDTTFQ
ncbi:MAG: ProQ/FINO family protein [Azospirillaceae bacterium]|nr:ProQ/FINO family protein [Azospirillaceae bacterium]